jgi:hypothetical protein
MTLKNPERERLPPPRRLDIVKHLWVMLAFTLGAPLIAQTRVAPPDLVALAAQARLEPPVAWCGGVLRPGRRHGYAAAVQTPTGGRYVVLEPKAPALELGPFTATPSLACYTPAEARQLSATIASSETIEGTINPRTNAMVICGFSDATTATCWQYSPADRRFVTVGGWTT